MAVKNKVALVVLDGYGHSEEEYGNAIAAARTPNLDRLAEEHPVKLIKAHGTEVGLPTDDDMGNSEVGHNAMGSGQIYAQGAKLVNQSVETGRIFESETWNKLVNQVKVNDSILHFIGLLSDGGVHSHIDHLKSLVSQAKVLGIKTVRVHALLDGRDTPPNSGGGFVDDLEAFFAELNDDSFNVNFASGGGRMQITMDRYESNWGMVELGWRTHVLGEGRQFASASEAYATLTTETGAIDQDVPPFIIAEDGQPIGKIEDGDSVVFYNFRGDRAIEISRAFDEADFDAFDRVRVPDVEYAGMLEYDTEAHIPSQYLVNPPFIKNTLSDHLCSLGVKSYAVAESQKFGHVTYFWNGNASGYIDPELELYEEVTSDVVPFQNTPWMKSAEVADKLIEKIESDEFDFVRCNLANPDMVGHTGVYESTIIGIEACDLAVGRIAAAAKKAGYILVITADHGNAEAMFDSKKDADGNPVSKTSHTTNPVPFYVCDGDKVWTFKADREYGLSNVASTVCDLLGVDTPAEDWNWNPTMVEA